MNFTFNSRPISDIRSGKPGPVFLNASHGPVFSGQDHQRDLCFQPLPRASWVWGRGSVCIVLTHLLLPCVDLPPASGPTLLPACKDLAGVLFPHPHRPYQSRLAAIFYLPTGALAWSGHGSHKRGSVLFRVFWMQVMVTHSRILDS